MPFTDKFCKNMAKSWLKLDLKHGKIMAKT